MGILCYRLFYWNPRSSMGCNDYRRIITYRILNIADLTVEGSLAMGAAISAQAISSGINPYGATVLALLGGLAAGLITGILHTKLKIPALLAGILTMIALYSINLRIMGKANISLLRMDTVYTWFQNFGLSETNSVIVLGFLFVLALICILYWFFELKSDCYSC